MTRYDARSVLMTKSFLKNVESCALIQEKKFTDLEDLNKPTGEEEAVDEAEDPNETTSLLGRSGRTTFKRYSSPRRREEEEAATHAEPSEEQMKRHHRVYGGEQPWSAPLPSSLWLLQVKSHHNL